MQAKEKSEVGTKRIQEQLVAAKEFLINILENRRGLFTSP
jgi:hypothetical protein